MLQTRFKEEAVKESYTGVNSWDFRPKLPGSQLSCLSLSAVFGQRSRCHRDSGLRGQ